MLCIESYNIRSLITKTKSEHSYQALNVIADSIPYSIMNDFELISASYVSYGVEYVNDDIVCAPRKQKLNRS